MRDGDPIASASAATLTVPASQPGAYRVEARLRRNGGTRLWIISNPIYLRNGSAAK